MTEKDKCDYRAKALDLAVYHVTKYNTGPEPGEILEIAAQFSQFILTEPEQHHPV